MRVLVGAISHPFHYVETLPPEHQAAVLDPSSYTSSQAFARALPEDGSDGLVYPSVRDRDGHCVGAFWPDVIGIPRQERHLQYEWDGERVGRNSDFSLDRWMRLEPS